MRQCVISDVMDCGSPYRGAPPWDLQQRRKELSPALRPLHTANHQLCLTTAVSGGDRGSQFSHEQTETQVTQTRRSSAVLGTHTESSPFTDLGGHFHRGNHKTKQKTEKMGVWLWNDWV